MVNEDAVNSELWKVVVLEDKQAPKLELPREMWVCNSAASNTSECLSQLSYLTTLRQQPEEIRQLCIRRSCVTAHLSAGGTLF